MDRRVMLTLALSLGLSAGCQAIGAGPSGHPTFSLAVLEGPSSPVAAPALAETALLPGLLPGETLPEPLAVAPVRTSGGGGRGGSTYVPALDTPAGTGVLTIDLKPFMSQFAPAAQRRVLATVADIAYVTITVEVPGIPSQTQTILASDLSGGTGSATFSGLDPGTATVTVKAFDAANTSIGSSIQTAAIAMGVNTIINFVIQLDPTYVPGAGDVITDVTFIDGPVVVGTPPPVPAASGTVIGTYGVGDKPEAIAFDSTGNVWVANFGSGNVTKLGPAGGAFGSYKPAAGLQPAAVAVDAADNVYLADYNQTGGLFKLKAADGSLIAKLTAGPFPVAMAVDKVGLLWSANYLTRTLTRLSLAGVPPKLPPGSPIGATSVGEYPIAVAIDSLNFAWAVNFKGHTLAQVDPTGKLVQTVKLQGASEPEGVAIDPLSGAIWVTHNKTGKVTKVSPTGTVVGQFTVGARPRGVAIDKAGYVWVANSDSGTVMKLGQDGTVQKTIKVGTAPRAIGVDPSGFVWVTNSGDDTVTKIAP